MKSKKSNKHKIIYDDKIPEVLKRITSYYTETTSARVAWSMVKNIEDAIKGLNTMPQRCKKINGVLNIRKLILKKPPYTIYYYVDDKAKEVEILDILHNKQDSSFIEEKYK